MERRLQGDGSEAVEAARAAILQRMRRDRRNETVWRWSGLLVLMVVWEIAGRLGISFLFPPVSAIVRAWWDLIRTGDLIEALLVSMQSFLLGYGLALAVGIFTGLLMGRYAGVRDVLNIYLDFFMSAPMIAAIPVILLLFGVDLASKVFLVFLFAYFAIAVNTYTGVREIPIAIREMARSFGTTERDLFFKVLLPGSLPAVMAGVRIGMGRAIMGMVVGEMLMSLTGLGAMIAYYGSSYIADRMFATLWTIILLAILFEEAVRWVERRFAGWRLG